jgi:two-component system sensor histidine kinase/response regulator
VKAPAILIVEDEGIIARDIRQQLGELGYDVVGDTATGEDAILLTGRLKPDLVLMDIHLAGQLDGIETAQVIRKEHGTPVVFLTAFAGAETLERAKVTDAFGYIIKPFDERYLHTVIEMALYKHRAESDLRRAYDEHATVLRTALDAYFLADWQGRLLEVNDSSCAMLGYTREELLRMSLADLDASPDASRIAIIEGLKQPEAVRSERAQRRKDGRAILVEMSVNYLPHSGGRIFCFARDITDRKAAEDALMRLNEELEVRVSMRTEDLEEARKDAENANKAKASFLANMTHELRTPLNGVIGMLDVMKQTTLESHQVEMLDLAAESATSLLGIVDDILDFSKIEAGRLGIESLPFSLEEVVENTCAVLSPLAEKLNVELTLFTDPALPARVLGDAVRLKQVLLNLANNAVKFSSLKDRRSRVSVKAAVASQSAHETTLVFEVKDDGIGMEPETIAGLFRSFTQGDASITRRFGGTGLGLAICRNLAELMGGRIQVSSEPGKGSTFTLSVPFARPHESQSHPRGNEVAGVSCLLISGSPERRHDFAAYLAAAGASVVEAKDLAAAAGQKGVQRTSPFVCVLDVETDLPDPETLRAVRAGADPHESGFVLIDRTRPRRTPPPSPEVVVIDSHLLKREAFLNAVACAAGRLKPSTQTTPAAIRRTPSRVPSRQEAIGARELILVAEDNDVNQKVILRQLGLLGYTADVAKDGAEALKLWQTGDYSLLFADLHMPAMDGYQLTSGIRLHEGAGQHAVIVALTADVIKGGAQQCRDAGLDDYLCKPARLSELKAMLEKWMPRNRTAAVLSSKGGAVESPVDISVLEELVGRDPDVIHEFLRAFWLSTAKTATEIKEACLNREAAKVSDLAHKLKAPAKSVGALRLAQICSDMQKAASASNLDDLSRLLPLLEAEKARVEEYLRPA